MALRKPQFGLDLKLFERGVSLQEVCVFARQFATMIGSGVPLVRCLSILHQQSENPTFRRIVGQIRGDVEGGSAFSKTLESIHRYSQTCFATW